jgi:hypothetical protein
VKFRTDSGVLGSVTVSQVSAGRKNRLWFEFDRDHRFAVFDQEKPDHLARIPETSAEILNRDPSDGSPDQRRPSKLPAGRPRDTPNASRTSLTTPTPPFEPREGLPTFDECHDGS